MLKLNNVMWSSISALGIAFILMIISFVILIFTSNDVAPVAYSAGWYFGQAMIEGLIAWLILFCAGILVSLGEENDYGFEIFKIQIFLIASVIFIFSRTIGWESVGHIGTSMISYIMKFQWLFLTIFLVAVVIRILVWFKTLND